MIVTDIRTLLCHAYRTNWVFVLVETDAGLTGLGEATLELRETTVAEACAELNRYLLGRDPAEIEAFWHEAYRDAYWRGEPVLSSALAGVEMALWDIKGKVHDAPVWQLMGGKVRNEVPCYANGWFAPAKTPDEFAAKARDAVAAGYINTQRWDTLPAGHAERRRKNIPLGAEAQSRDIAEAAMFLASPAAGNITGARLVVDGGCSAQHMPADVDL